MKQIKLTVDHDSLPRFTTLLQNGIHLEVKQGTNIGDLLFALPGFSTEYVKNRVQTIFLNGLPADSLEQQLFGEQVVLAISAAMPGLAGAIFRKDGVHASLRTETAAQLSGSANSAQPVQVRLKLFNMIAAERGVDILEDGCIVTASGSTKFLAYRPPLLANIGTATINDKEIDASILASNLEPKSMIALTIRSTHGN